MILELVLRGILDVTEASSGCTLNVAYWDNTHVLDGETVRLIIEGTNCDGEEIEFEIREDDFGTSDYVTNPSNIIYNSPNNYGIWIADYTDDAGFGQLPPPEYYFIATVISNGNSITSPTSYVDMLIVEDITLCMGINYCYQYETEDDCNENLCAAGEKSVPSEITCGETFNPITGCTEYINCGCGWNIDLNTCETTWNADVSCGTLENIGECTYTENSGDTCENDGLLTRILIAIWEWSPLNPTHLDPEGSEAKCEDIEYSMPCPAAVQLPFFGIYQIVISLILVALVYSIYFSRKKEKYYIQKRK